jgi:hypothetical protein
MAVAGLRGTGDWGTDERPKNFRETILWRDPNGSAPLTALMSKMKKETTDDPEYSWWEEELTIVRLTATTVTATTTTTIGLSAGNALDLKEGDVLLIEAATETAGYADELVRVAVTPTATNSIGVTRGAANTTAAAIANGAKLTLIGSAYMEGTTSSDASSRNPTKVLNYTQIFKDSYEITGTAEKTRTRTGDPVKNDKKRKMFDHATRQEFAYLFGKKYEDTSTTKITRYTGGMLQFLASATASYAHTSKVWTTAATVDTFLDAIYPVFDYGTPSGSTAGNERLVLAGNGALNVMNKLAKGDGQIQYDSTVKVYGMELRKYILPQGTLYLRTHPLMNVHGRFKNSMFVLDPSGIVYRPMKDRDTRMQDNIQANDADSRKGQWITEAGIEPHHMATMSYQGNMS